MRVAQRRLPASAAVRMQAVYSRAAAGTRVRWCPRAAQRGAASGGGVGGKVAGAQPGASAAARMQVCAQAVSTGEVKFECCLAQLMSSLEMLPFLKQAHVPARHA